eukprot:SAG31_NODE_12527_length_935_cov_0.994019_1_plen_34_part_10
MAMVGPQHLTPRTDSKGFLAFLRTQARTLLLDLI